MPELAPKKKDLALEAKKPATPAKAPADGKSNPLKGMTLEEQQALLKPNRATENDPNAKKAPPPPGESPYERVLGILAQNKLPACLAPRNIASFEYKAAGGQLTLNLTAGFTKEIVDDKGKTHEVKFDQRILMTAWQGRLTSIQGVSVPSSSGARLTDIQVMPNGYLRLTGKLGIFSKSLDIKESDFPALP